MKLLWTWTSLVILVTHTFAQGVLPPAPAGSSANPVEAPPVPFASNTPKEADVDSAITLLNYGQSDLADGFVSDAVRCFNQALAFPNLDSTIKDRLNLGLVTAYLAEGQLGNAAGALQLVAATDTPAYLLRAALLQSTKADGAAAAGALLARIDPGKLSSTDLPWYFTVQARLAEYQSNADAANAAWQQAIDHAPPLLQGLFEAARWDSQFLLNKTPTPEEVEKLHAEMDAATIPSLGAHFASLYALGLDQTGQHDQALVVVKRWVDLPDLDPKNRDMLRLVLVTLDGKGPAPADPALDPQTLAARDQQALEDILQEPIDISSPDRDAIMQMQEQALNLLEQRFLTPKPDNSQSATNIADLKKFIDSIIADPDMDSHPLLKKLYLFQARLALALDQTTVAEDAANELLKKYPPGAGSDPVDIDAQMVLADAYWHHGQPDGQPLMARDNLLKVDEGLPDDQRAPVDLSLAYLYYTTGDFANAAVFYSKLLTEPNLPIARGEILLRAVESELMSGQIDNAIQLMDRVAMLDDVTPEYRWKAEWNLLQAMRQTRPDDAMRKLNSLVDLNQGANLLPPELYLRFLWLKADLAVSQADPQAGDSVDTLKKEVESLHPETIPGYTTEQRNDLANICIQLEAEALLLQGEAVVLPTPADAAAAAKQLDDQRKIFEDLRQRFSNPDPAISDPAWRIAISDPALRSYLIEASELEAQNKTVEAQRLYNTVTDDFPKSDYAPYALFNSALDSASLGKTDEALALLQKLVTDKDYAGNDALTPLLYKAGFTEASLEEKINTAPSLENARDIYADLIKKIPTANPGSVKAKILRAECLFELATLPDADPQRRQDAIDELQVLYNQTNLPADIRVEIGYEWGNLLEYASTPDHLAEAIHVFSMVRDDILDNEQARTELDNSPDGRAWMLKCLTSLKEIYGNQKNEREAAQVDRIISQYNLNVAVLPAGQDSAPAPKN